MAPPLELLAHSGTINSNYRQKIKQTVQYLSS